MKFAIEALLVLAGFAAGVIFSGAVHVYAGQQLDKAHAAAEGLKKRLDDLEQKVKSRF